MKRVTEKADVVRLRFEDNGLARNLFGVQDQNLKTIEKRLGVHINVRGPDVSVQGEHGEVSLVERLLTELYGMAKKGFPVSGADVERAIQVFSGDANARLQDLLENSLFVPFRNRVIIPKSINQRDYMEVIHGHDLVFGIGPAGTGKTYLAVAMAVLALSKKEVSRIILSRPAVEAGEKLGFLPGDMYQKISPYLRPLYDALCEMMEYEKVMKLVETGVIEVAPLAYMRGRTLNGSFIVLDEAQNCTGEQMKMFLTRLGFNSKAVITGDVTQVDLPRGARSGLIEAQGVLADIPGIGFQYFNDRDVVRHPLVSEIVRAYDKNKNGMGLKR
ncbi:MAG: PhoH family protein [Deltaproteobacteria bacterium]|nr:PhoH family protein [Deltaproteobacteria bacterium]MBI4374049.1 PhoH family protein [Deltaproteobacteria bacterium]